VSPTRTLVLALTLATILGHQTTLAQAQATQKTPARKRTTASTTTPVAAAVTPAPTPACTCPATTNTTPVPQRHYPPYTATQENRHVQTLADGTTITTVTQSLLARDAQGRTRMENIRTQPDGTEFRSVSLTDIAAGMRYTWTVSPPPPTKVVSVYHFNRPAAQALQLTANPAAARRYYPYINESLPPQTIDGYYVEGSRNTRTTPAGYEGNDRDLVFTNENWTSPVLGLSIRTIVDDPRNGKTTTELHDIQQTDPDPSLFIPPSGYTLKEIN
jgi:hypothetical protein